MVCFVVILLTLTAIVVAEDDKTLAMNFLNRYHYISQTRSGNHNVKTAIGNFQKYFHLPVSGELDKATVSLMKKSRCGMPDGDEHGGLRKRRYVTTDRWGKSALTYYIEYGQDLDNGTQSTIFQQALQFWADQSSLSFSQISSASDADIKISFGANTHEGTKAESTCPDPFDGEGRVLAHAFYPEDGRAHFDEAEQFTYQSQSGHGIDLLWVATHEFGHSLGLKHTDVRGAVMYPYYMGYTPDMKLHSDDIAGIQSLYGGPGSEPVTPVCKDKSSNCLDYKNLGYCEHPQVKEQMQLWCWKSCSGCS